MGAVNRSKVERKRQAQILRFWRAVEYFSPPDVPRVNPRNKMFPVWANQPLPWEPGSAISRMRFNEKRAWQHTVYAGIFSIDKVRDVLLEAFRSPESEQDFDGRISGDSALLCFTVNEAGQLLKESVTLSSCAWAVSQTLDPGPHDARWLTGFEEQCEDLTARLLDLGDGKIDVEREPPADRGGPAPSLGPVAGLMSKLALGVAKGGIGLAASSVTAGLGPVAGPIAAKVVEQVGSDMAESAMARLTDRTAGKGNPPEEQNSSEADASAESPDASEEPEEPPAEVGTKVLDVYDLAAITRWVAERLGVAAVLKPDAIRVRSYEVSAKRADEPVGDVFLNSFYADDLARVANALEKGQSGTALLNYLRAEEDLDAMRRFDVRRLPETVLEHVQPSSMPAGRWPADDDKPLVLSQQFAVNRIIETLGTEGGRGIYAVNGPPGTGKTTMLRDLIAAVVVQRAERLAVLKSPEDAFTRKPLRWRTEETAGKTFAPTLFPLIPALSGFEIVIASSNNGAVENVTLEVPSAQAIGEAWKPHAEYLSGPASLLLKGEAWGAIAACLGKRSNRSGFVERFWWGKAEKPDHQRTNTGELRVGLHKMLQTQSAYAGSSASNSVTAAEEEGAESDQSAPLGRETWTQAVRQFNQARRKVRELTAKRQEIADLARREAGPDALLGQMLARETDAHRRVDQLRSERRRCCMALERSEQEHTRRQRVVIAIRGQLEPAEARVKAAEQGVRAAEAALHAHDARKPGIFKRVFSREARQRWESERVPLETRLQDADADLAAQESTHQTVHGELRTAQGQLDQALTDVQRAQWALSACEQRLEEETAQAVGAGQQVQDRHRELEQNRRQLDAARRRWGAAVPGPEWRADPDDRQAMEARELSAPWMDPEIAEARTALFLAALDLHRALLTAAPEKMRKNLLAAMDVVKGKAPRSLPAETVLAAWRMLFLVVPVVSTTFASMGRMFDKLGSETLGWLFVDEAGQAAPQEVIGALWRSRRAVVVGDPLQLEPVVPLPWTGQKRLASHFEVDRQWTPAAGSVQTLADRLNSYGTWLKDGEGENVWLGSPLRVHRRCDRLMFEVSNKIAYDGMMVYGVLREGEEFPLARWSVWRDVGSLPSDDKWNPEEGHVLEDSLRLIRDRISEVLQEEMEESQSVPLVPGESRGAHAQELTRRLNQSVFVVSPFRDVVNGIRRVVGSRLDDKRYGTVHTTQGKEADIVILVLGTGTGQVGSRDWASKNPNLLNVAVTRARRRLIVIGDFNTWSRHRYFSDLAHHDQLQIRPTRGERG
ncbi:DEAD/DEAH box helicase [Streptomyces marispadix]|uniref:AAA domain-containing protein n=1 Tax=Streptomyces marispadix TaxID=2922868 RepID=A0ABS9SZ67_9ACTN|nr:AAA domain-containing protein [Streptomyces marispadix]MCH6161570.1 AAA domain-containing protein [Streptomyces marispadix]